MALQPIDLQALFLHMNQPAKDQAVSRDAVIQSQSAQANKIVEQSLQTQDDVTPAAREDERDLRIKDKEAHEFEKKEKREGRHRNGPEEEAPQAQVFVDDRVGRKIDLKG